MYFTITDNDGNNNGIPCTYGINTTKKRGINRFCFAKKQDIHKLYDYGTNIQVVIIPEDNPDVMLTCNDGRCYANKIIVGKEYSLFDPLTYVIFGLSHYPDWLIDRASAMGNLAALQWWKESGLDLKYSQHAIDNASKNGHILILRWWLNSGFTILYSKFAMYNATQNNHTDILQWWLDSGLELKYDIEAIDVASRNGCMPALVWWFNSGLSLKYSENAIDYASRNSKIDVLNLWKYRYQKDGLILKYTKAAMDFATKSCDLIILQWWLDSGLELKYSDFPIVCIVRGYSDIVYNWSKYNHIYNEVYGWVCYWSRNETYVEVLQWWKQYYIDWIRQEEYAVVNILIDDVCNDVVFNYPAYHLALRLDK